MAVSRLSPTAAAVSPFCLTAAGAVFLLLEPPASLRDNQDSSQPETILSLSLSHSLSRMFGHNLGEMEVGGFGSDVVALESMVVCSVVEAVVVETLLAALRSLACLLMVTGSLLNDVDVLPKLTLIDERFPIDELQRRKNSGPENKDASDTDDDDEDDDGEDIDDPDDDEGNEGFSSEEARDNDDGDPDEDPAANGNGGSDEDDNEEDGDDDDDDDEEDEEEEEDEQPPAKKRK